MASMLRSAILAGFLAAVSAQRPGIHTVRRFLAGSGDEPLVLAQTSVQRTESASRGQNAGGRHGEPLQASWFDSFALGESSYDTEADRSAQRSDGWEYKRDNPYKEGGVMQAAWYHESPSGGSKEAWQTHFPSLTGGPSGRVESMGAWHVTQGGHWTQDYNRVDTVQTGPNRAAWYESSISQYDGFGRPKAPSLGSAKLYAEGYAERSVNTTLACREAGCSATTFLQAFNGNTEIARECKLSLYLHPTDFDDQYSGERLTFIKVNGITVNTDCFPMLSGCNASAQSPMFSCLQELPLDNLIDSSGFLNITAQISDVVDECPYQGNLLSGVPLVTCMVTPRPPVQAPGLGPQPAHPVVSSPPPEATYFHFQVPLHCPARGCVANANLEIGPHALRRLDHCGLTMKVFQTDFDNLEDSNEAIEYIQVNGEHVAANVTPGGNPCRALWAGHSVSLAQVPHVALLNYNVTSLASAGLVSIAAKITDHVDECAHDGFLLDALAELNCTLLPSSALEVTPPSPAVAHNASNATSLVQLSAPTVLLGQAESGPASGPEGAPEGRHGLREALMHRPPSAAEARPPSLREALLERQAGPRHSLRDALLDRLRGVRA